MLDAGAITLLLIVIVIKSTTKESLLNQLKNVFKQ